MTPITELSTIGPDLHSLFNVNGTIPDGLWMEVVSAMNEGLLLVGPDRRIVYLNQKAEEIVGKRLDEVRGSLCVDAIGCPQCKCSCLLFEDGRADKVEITIYSKEDGRKRVLLKNARLLKGPGGEIIGGVETFSDITVEVQQRVQNERYTSMLFREKTRVDALIDAMAEGVLAVDRDFRVLTCAPRAAELLELDPTQEATGRSLWELLGVSTDFFGTGLATELSGKSFQVTLGRSELPGRSAELSFRRVRFSDDEMLCILRVVDAAPRRASAPDDRFHGIVSRSPRMREIFTLVENAAQTQSSILIEGESGVGKELVARAIHQLSPRREQPFYAVNCATFTGSLLLSELFGHERGAFTGAYKSAPGKLELAGEGTLFLDEVSEIPLHYQAVLLRVIEERHFERVGGRHPINLRARIIAATNVCLSQAVAERKFRDDLYFRLKVVPITVPPLRQRPEDIALLAQFFASHPAVNLTGRRIQFSDEALQSLEAYSWPGNVRELRNLVEYLCFVAVDRIEVEHLPTEVRQNSGLRPASQSTPLPVSHASAAQACEMAGSSVDDNVQREAVIAALEKARYRRTEAARILGINRTTLWRRMKRLGLG